VRSRAAARAARAMVSTSVFDVLAGVKHALQDSRKGQVGCGKNGTRGAIFHKRRLLGEYILAVCKAGIWRMSDEMKAHAPKLIIQ
jgi:hypothetical protein